MSERENLVKMANQIADNFAYHDDAVTRTVDHLQRFWAPSMRTRLAEITRDKGNGLNPVARAAAGGLDDG
jgi:formate dehydrogenase subunit delta